MNLKYLVACLQEFLIKDKVTQAYRLMSGVYSLLLMKFCAQNSGLIWVTVISSIYFDFMALLNSRTSNEKA